MSGPVRVQQRRTKGWRKPENTVSVARPSRWGNPFRVFDGSVVGPTWGELRALPIGTRLRARDEYSVYSTHSSEDAAIAQAVDLFLTLALVTRRDSPDTFEAWIAPLRGKNLMCFCRFGRPCHAYPLLDLANAEVRS